MKSHDMRQRDIALAKAEVLTEALPWINHSRGKTVVVKYGGAAMEDPELMRQVVGDVELLKLMGMRVVLVHGGGKAINKLLGDLDLPVRFKNGLRVTDDATMEAVQEVLIGKVNQQLVWALNEYGHNAVGISGADGKTFKSEQVDPELGRVGTIREVDVSLIETILEDDYIPVIASVGCGPDGFYNINADVAAGRVAAALNARRLVYMSDVPGLLSNPSDPTSLISTLKVSQVDGLKKTGVIDKGMRPKVASAVRALEEGVQRVHFIDGRLPHSLLLEIFTDKGIGTEIVQG